MTDRTAPRERQRVSHQSPVTRWGSVGVLALWCAGALATVWFTGCGYSGRSLLPPNFRKIYVAPFINKLPITSEASELQRFATSLPRLEEDVTNKVINRYIFDGNLRVTPKKEEADLVLTGELVDFRRQALQLADTGGVEEYRLNLVANLALRETKSGTLRWEEPGFVGDTTYFLTGSQARTETAAVDALLTDFARRVVERTIEDW